MSSMPTVSDSRRRRLRQSLTAAEAMASAAPSQPFVLRLHCRRAIVKAALLRHTKPWCFNSGVVENTIRRARLLAFSIPSYG